MKNVKMILTNGFEPDARVLKEAKHLSNNGFEVEILCWDRENTFLSKPEELVDNILIRRFFPKSTYGTKFKQIIPYLKFCFEIRKYLKNKTVDYIHFHDLDGMLSSIFIKNRGFTKVFDMHEYYIGRIRRHKIKNLVGYLVNYFVKRVDFVIYVNPIQLSSLKQTHISKTVYLPNYAEKELFYVENKPKHKELSISYIGSVRQYSLLKKLCDSLQYLSDVNISIHGSGVDFRKLKDIEQNYPNVNISGRFKYSESPELYRKTDLLYAIFSLDTDQKLNVIPVKFFEAMLTLTPVIVNKGSRLAQLVKELDVGFIVDGEDTESIREIVNSILIDLDILDLKINNIKKIRDNYSWDDISRNLNLIYK